MQQLRLLLSATRGSQRQGHPLPDDHVPWGADEDVQTRMPPAHRRTTVAEGQSIKHPQVERLDAVERRLHFHLPRGPGVDHSRVLRVVAAISSPGPPARGAAQETDSEVPGPRSRSSSSGSTAGPSPWRRRARRSTNRRGLEGRPALGEDEVGGEQRPRAATGSPTPLPPPRARCPSRRRPLSAAAGGLARCPLLKTRARRGRAGSGPRGEAGEVDEVAASRRGRARCRTRQRVARGRGRRPRRSGGCAGNPAATPARAPSRGRTRSRGQRGTAAARSSSPGGGGRG